MLPIDDDAFDPSLIFDRRPSLARARPLSQARQDDGGSATWQVGSGKFEGDVSLADEYQGCLD